MAVECAPLVETALVVTTEDVDQLGLCSCERPLHVVVRGHDVKRASAKVYVVPYAYPPTTNRPWASATSELAPSGPGPPKEISVMPSDPNVVSSRPFWSTRLTTN